MGTHRKPSLQKVAITSRRSIKDTLKHYHQPCLHRRIRPHGPCGARRHERGHTPILGGWIVYHRSELDSELPIPIVRSAFACLGAKEFATMGGTKLTTMWRANNAKMADSREGEEESFSSVDACYCCQCDDAVCAVLKLNSCVIFRQQGMMMLERAKNCLGKLITFARPQS